jgi:hypothetical protein
MPLILPGNVASATAGGYEVANSCRFNQPDSAKMSITPASDGNKRTWTWSAWIKIGKPGNFGGIFFAGVANGADNITDIYLDDDGKLFLRDVVSAGTLEYYVSPNRVFRDHSAWYHIVYAVDTTQGTASNRVKLYINGTQETSLAENTYPSENYETNINDSSYAHDLGHGLKTNGNSFYFDGYMAEVCFIDGTAYAASDFGEFDSDSPTIWKPKDVSGLTFGTNGFYLDFEDSSNLGNDANGGTDLTETNLAATDQATDTPTNNFATLNSLVTESGSTFSEGNCKVVTSSSLGGGNFSTIAASAGKWYAEFKFVAESASNESSISVSDTSHVANFNDGDYTTFLSEYAVGNWGLRGYNGRSYITSSGSQGSSDSQHDGWSLNDIIGVALDCDNHKVYFSKNGGWQDAVDSWGGSSPDSYLTIQADFGEGSYVFGVGDSGTSQNVTWECNFGGCSAFTISSAASDENGYGAFEYAPPSGYLALCTKNLGSDGG